MDIAKAIDVLNNMIVDAVFESEHPLMMLVGSTERDENDNLIINFHPEERPGGEPQEVVRVRVAISVL
jgi:hypothetical protein